MNIFYLHTDPCVAAKAMTDKHIVKMILESAQMLCTAHRVLDGKLVYSVNENGRNTKSYSHPSLDEVLYKSAYVNHPSAVWVREASGNYMWLYFHFVALNEEYTRRYNRVHSSYIKLNNALQCLPININDGFITSVALAMPDKYKQHNGVESYRAYYMNEKIKTEDDLMRFQQTLNC
jgi:hypothetical protein